MDPGESIVWGSVSSLGYAFILFEISFGEARHLSRHGDDPHAKRTFDLLFRFLFLGWAIYPLGYMTNPGNLLEGWDRFLNVDAIYNLGDAVNKIGFGLVGVEPGPRRGAAGRGNPAVGPPARKRGTRAEARSAAAF